MSRVRLSDIKSLTFFADALTKAKRTPPISQLTCFGKACELYQPDAVRCINIGGYGIDVDWKCEADLPNSLRFGRIDVSCEGWSGPDDPYVLKGSCALEYSLVPLHKSLRDDVVSSPWLTWDTMLNLAFNFIWLAVLVIFAYSFFGSCCSARRNRRVTGPDGNSGPVGPGGTRPGPDDHPRPYTPYSFKTYSDSLFNPGFWTGLGMGVLGAFALGRNRDDTGPRVQRSMWDWERPATGTGWFGGRPAGTTFARRPRPSSSNEDRGEGSSRLGSMRSSTGIGRSSVR
ncbi:DUF1183-domain-containing protein [Sistotremastrum suecicum HHB10207 ss-3]|uniref:Store-operated calcium entry-associated regulatory factor n=1 Tax=Sistotremastrum suecicum HHB10207 ss-3 TaxID=1314776 RepID=A0A166H214_9AGAM|nr:DUF1183-domain-containing protein [Sistotremastrum suecicum HHB10207 ss-3]